jgi:hypothetical protein
LPQSPQNFALGLSGRLQWLQVMLAAVPQFGQNLDDAGWLMPQLPHSMVAAVEDPVRIFWQDLHVDASFGLSVPQWGHLSTLSPQEGQNVASPMIGEPHLSQVVSLVIVPIGSTNT